MKVRLDTTTARDLRRLSYELLSKLHDLERPKKIGALFATRLSGRPAALRMVEHVTSVLSLVLQSLSEESDAIRASGSQLLERLPRLLGEIEQAIDAGAPLRTRTLAWVLTSHTETFNRISDEPVEVDFTEDLISEWVGAVQCAVATWKDNFEAH